MIMCGMKCYYEDGDVNLLLMICDSVCKNLLCCVVMKLLYCDGEMSDNKCGAIVVWDKGLPRIWCLKFVTKDHW